MPAPLPAPPVANAPAGVPSLRTLGTSSVEAAAGDDPRLATPSNARTTAAAGKIPIADGTGRLHPAWLPVTGPGAVVPGSRQVIAGPGLTGGGDLTADRTFNIGANADGSIVVNANDIQVGILATDAQHGSRGGGGLHALATPASHGFMSAADKAKLDYSVADWDMATTRYYAVDYDAGSDNALGYSDVSMAASGAVALKTLTELRARLPTDGAGRQVVVAIKGRSGAATYKKKDGSTDDSLDLRGLSGYRYFLVRGTDSFANDAADKVRAGAVQAQVGPNGDGSWTCAGGGTTSVFSVAAGALTPEPALIQKRIRFKGNVTGALANVCRNVYANTSGQITLGNNLGVAPAAGDELFIEQPGVLVDTVYDAVNAVGGFIGSSGSFGETAVVGIAALNAFLIEAKSGMEVAQVAFCEITTSSAIQNFGIAGGGAVVQIGRSYFDEAGTSRAVGVGFRCASSFFWGNMLRLDAGAVGMMNASAGTIVSVQTFDIGTLGGYFERMPKFLQCGQASRVGSAVTTQYFGSRSANDRHTRVNGNTNITNWVESHGSILKVDFANCSAGACIRPEGLGLSLSVDDCTGSSGNTAFGIDTSACYDCHFAFGVTTANTVTGTAGDIKLPGGAVTTHAGLAITNVVDQNGNQHQGPAGVIVSTCIKVTNRNGSSLSIGDIVRSNGVSGEVVAALADTEAHASGPLVALVTPPADGAVGYAAPLTDRPVVNFTAPPPAGALCYLSETTAGRATSAPPPLAGANQKRRLGHTIIVETSNSRAQVVGLPEALPVLANGLP